MLEVNSHRRHDHAVSRGDNKSTVLSISAPEFDFPTITSQQPSSESSEVEAVGFSASWLSRSSRKAVQPSADSRVAKDLGRRLPVRFAQPLTLPRADRIGLLAAAATLLLMVLTSASASASELTQRHTSIKQFQESVSSSNGGFGTVRGMRKATATWYGPGLYGNKTACGKRLTRKLRGVAHRTLPCGRRLKIRYNGKVTVVKVIDRGPYVSGIDFDLTSATAGKLGFSGVDTIAYKHH